tara:strand:+ start:145 stop:489 length:345 start_codon:yes stop_codon:yes gene_type:complete
MSFWSAVGTWAMGQFTSNFLGGGNGGSGEGDIWGKIISAGATTLGDKYLGMDKPSPRPPIGSVDFGVTKASTYRMSDAQGPDTPEVADYASIEAKWTRIAKKLGDIKDTTAIGS